MLREQNKLASQSGRILVPRAGRVSSDISERVQRPRSLGLESAYEDNFYVRDYAFVRRPNVDTNSPAC